MAEKYPDRTKEWAKQQEALKNPKPLPAKASSEDKINEDKKTNQ